MSVSEFEATTEDGRWDIDRSVRYDHPVNNNRGPNNERHFTCLTTEEQEALVSWIKRHFTPAKRRYWCNSYEVKHWFDQAHTSDGFYVTNGQFKGALKAAGFRIADESKLNWEFYAKWAVRCTHINERGIECTRRAQDSGDYCARHVPK